MSHLVAGLLTVATLLSVVSAQESYVLIKQPSTWDEFNQACKNKSLTMAMVRGKAEAQRFHSTVKKTVDNDGCFRHYYIGLTKEKGQMDYTWPGANATLTYSLFAPRPMKTQAKKRSCAVAIYWNENYMKWGSRSCLEKHCGVCQTVDT